MEIKKWITYTTLILILFTFFLPRTISAESQYVLPYPGSMPGSKLYKAHLLWENVLRYWHYGNFGQFKYNLKQSDKYLVEAKTLFEYKQYLLGYNALKKSDNYFEKISPALEKARKENKDIVQKQNLLNTAGLKHIEVLNSIVVPDKFVWSPEKASSTILEIKKAIDESIGLRTKIIK